MITTFIFDWGSVLAESSNHAAARLIAGTTGKSEEEIFHTINTFSDQDLTTPDYSGYIRRIEQAGYSSSEVFSAQKKVRLHATYDLARSLKSKGYSIVLLSDQMKERADWIRATFDLSFFDHVFFSNETGLRKPWKKTFEHCLKEIGKDASACIFIDDKQENIDSACELGITGILYTHHDALLDRLIEEGITISEPLTKR